jgi:hypothetical protein
MPFFRIRVSRFAIFHHVLDLNMPGRGSAIVKTDHLARNLRDAPERFLGRAKQIVGRDGPVFFPQQEKGIRKCRQRIVNFMGQSIGHAGAGGIQFAGAQCFFRSLQFGDVTGDSDNTNHGSRRIPADIFG